MITSRTTFCASIRCICCFRRSFSRARRTDARLRIRSPASSSASMMVILPDRRPVASSRRPGSTRRTSTRDWPSRLAASIGLLFLAGRSRPRPATFSAAGFLLFAPAPQRLDRPALAALDRFRRRLPRAPCARLPAPVRFGARRGREPPHRPALRHGGGSLGGRRRPFGSRARPSARELVTLRQRSAALAAASSAPPPLLGDAGDGMVCRSSSACMASCRARTRVAFSWLVSPTAAPSRGLPSGAPCRRTDPHRGHPSRALHSDTRPRASGAIRALLANLDGHHLRAAVREALPNLSGFHRLLQLQLSRPARLALLFRVAFVDFGHVTSRRLGLLAAAASGPARKPASRDASRAKRSASRPGRRTP